MQNKPNIWLTPVKCNTRTWQYMFIRIWLQTITIRHTTIKLGRDVLLIFCVSYSKSKLFWDFLKISLILNMRFFISLILNFIFFKMLPQISVCTWIITGIKIDPSPDSRGDWLLFTGKLILLNEFSCFLAVFLCVSKSGWSFCHWHFLSNYSFTLVI